MSPPVLVPPTEGKSLLLCITTTKTSLATLLGQEYSTGKEREIYYINKTLNVYEINYMSIEKACLVVVFATQQL
jgi:hypothetical protein